MCRWRAPTSRCCARCGGGLARTFGPDDPAGAAAAIAAALGDPGAVAADGPAWAARFTWAAAAAGTWQAYERALRCTSG